MAAVYRPYVQGRESKLNQTPGLDSWTGHQMTPQENSITTPLKSSIERHFPYLFEKCGFKFIDPEKNYGGNIVVAKSESLKIRFIRDRPDFFVDVGPAGEPERWIELYKIIDLLETGGHVHA